MSVEIEPPAPLAVPLALLTCLSCRKQQSLGVVARLAAQLLITAGHGQWHDQCRAANPDDRRTIVVNGCLRRCASRLATSQELEVESSLLITDLGFTACDPDLITDDMLQLACDAILAAASRPAPPVPRIAGCCRCC